MTVGQTLRLGRDPSCEIALPVHDGRISQVHAVVTVLGGGRFRIEDRRSTNGVFINNTNVQVGDFGFDDQVSLGSYAFDTRLLRPYGEVARGAQARPAGRWLRVGRENDNDIVIAQGAGQVSRYHARVRELGPNQIEIEDLNSSNGVFVNDRRVKHASVGSVDQVSFGSYLVSLSVLMPALPGPVARPGGSPALHDGQVAKGGGGEQRATAKPRRSLGTTVAVIAVVASVLITAGIFLFPILSSPGSPEATVERWLTAAEDGDFDAFLRYSIGPWRQVKADGYQVARAEFLEDRAEDDFEVINIGPARQGWQEFEGIGTETATVEVVFRRDRGRVDPDDIRLILVNKGIEELLKRVYPDSSFREGDWLVVGL